jgi:hypothetical protein
MPYSAGTVKLSVDGAVVAMRAVRSKRSRDDGRGAKRDDYEF